MYKGKGGSGGEGGGVRIADFISFCLKYPMKNEMIWSH